MNDIFDNIFGSPVSDEIRDQRLSICNSCEHKFVKVCTKCGCFVELKTKFSKTSCPENKWGEHISDHSSVG